MSKMQQYSNNVYSKNRKPGMLQATGSQGVGHNLVTEQKTTVRWLFFFFMSFMFKDEKVPCLSKDFYGIREQRIEGRYFLNASNTFLIFYKVHKVLSLMNNFDNLELHLLYLKFNEFYVKAQSVWSLAGGVIPGLLLGVTSIV